MRIEWAPKAEDDLHRLWMFAVEHSVERAETIAEAIRAEGDYVARHPSFGRPIDSSGRRDWAMVKHPYVLRYRVEEDIDTLRILRVWHGRENREG